MESGAHIEAFRIVCGYEGKQSRLKPLLRVGGRLPGRRSHFPRRRCRPPLRSPDAIRGRYGIVLVCTWAKQAELSRLKRNAAQPLLQVHGACRRSAVPWERLQPRCFWPRSIAPDCIRATTPTVLGLYLTPLCAQPFARLTLLTYVFENLEISSMSRPTVLSAGGIFGVIDSCQFADKQL